MKQALKRVIFAVVVCVMAAGNFSVFAAYSETVTPIIRDVDLIKVTNTTSAGRQNITMVRANLNNPNLALKTLFSPSGAGTLANVQQLADAHNAVAAVNADFFSWGSEAGTGSAVGYNVVNGQIVSSPCITEDVAAVATNLNGESLFAYFQRSMTITAPSGESAPIKHINKYDDLTGIVLYTPDWGKYSLGSHGTLVEVVVADGVVQEVRADMPPAEIPQNGYILAGLTDQTNFLTQVVHVGDKLQLDVKITPEFDTHNAVGGGTILVTDGKEAKITHNITGRQPRSAFGVDKTGKMVYLITVDGRGAGGSIGMTLEELRTFMLDVGIYNGINFDGGGSTQMVMRPDGKGDSTIINTPSQAPYRKVINALGIVLTGQAGIPEWVKVVPEMPTMFVNTGIDMSTVLYDQQYNVMDSSDATYAVEGVAGSMDTGRFVPTTSGTAVITAKTGGLYGTATVKVEPYPMKLMIDSDQYTMRRGEKKGITMRALTVNNEVIYVNSMYAKFTQTNPILKAVDGGIEAVAEGVTDITFQLGDVTATARVVVNDNPDIVEVEYNNGTDRFEYSNGGVYVYPSEVIGFYKISEEQAAEGAYSGKLWYDFLPDLGAVQSAGFNLTKPMLIDKPDSVVNIDVHAETNNGFV